MSTQTSTLTPATLAKKLLTSGGTLEELLEHFAEEAEQIAEILHSQEFRDHLQLRTDLALAKARLQAAAALPDCTAKLLALTNADKPEVARRAIMALIGITGLPTRVAPAPAPPSSSPPDDPEVDDTLDDDQDDDIDHDPRTFEQRQRDEQQQRDNEAVLSFHRNLYISRGINLLKITKLNFHGFADYLQAYFTPAGITFVRNDNTPHDFNYSIHNPRAVAHAQAYFQTQGSQSPGPQSLGSPPAPTPNINQNPNDSVLSAPSP